jgi:hypothetical protein
MSQGDPHPIYDDDDPLALAKDVALSTNDQAGIFQGATYYHVWTVDSPGLSNFTWSGLYRQSLYFRTNPLATLKPGPDMRPMAETSWNTPRLLWQSHWKGDVDVITVNNVEIDMDFGPGKTSVLRGWTYPLINVAPDP